MPTSGQYAGGTPTCEFSAVVWWVGHQWWPHWGRLREDPIGPEFSEFFWVFFFALVFSHAFFGCQDSSFKVQNSRRPGGVVVDGTCWYSVGNEQRILQWCKASQNHSAGIWHHAPKGAERGPAWMPWHDASRPSEFRILELSGFTLIVNFASGTNQRTSQSSCSISFFDIAVTLHRLA